MFNFVLFSIDSLAESLVKLPRDSYTRNRIDFNLFASMASNPCTLGTFKTVFSSAEVADHACPNPIVQVLQVKAIAAKPGTPERYSSCDKCCLIH